jgi:hypothetical protein
MPNTVPAADTGLPKSDDADAALDQFHLVNDANLLRHLVDAVDALLAEIPLGDDGRDRELQRIAALVRIGRDLADQISVDVAAIFQPKEMKPWMR